MATASTLALDDLVTWTGRIARRRERSIDFVRNDGRLFWLTLAHVEVSGLDDVNVSVSLPGWLAEDREFCRCRAKATRSDLGKAVSDADVRRTTSQALRVGEPPAQADPGRGG